MNQKEEMLKAMNIVEGLLNRVKENPPQIRFKWWSTGEPMNLEDQREWSAGCNMTYELIKNVRNAIEKDFYWHWTAVNDAGKALNLAEGLFDKYLRGAR